MKPINNIALMGYDGVLSQSHLSDELIQIEVPTNSEFTANILHLSGRINLKVILNDEQAKCNIKISYLSNKNNINNIKVEVIHKYKNTMSSQVVKGILTDESKMIFDGVIRIPFDSQKCDGHQNHRAILLSDTASVQATPELEIYADDVKCSHGSAVGGLDDSQLFYLLSRGIPVDLGKKILLKSYVMELLPETWEQYVDEWIDSNV